MERKAYEVMIESGKFFYKQTGEFIDTTGETKGAKWIFVLSTNRILYVGIKKKGSFQHSSFLSGGATLAAGRIVAEKGVLKVYYYYSLIIIINLFFLLKKSTRFSYLYVY